MEAAAAESAASALIADVIDATEQLPAMPDDCNQWQLARVEIGERLDLALLKTNSALLAANQRVRRCAGWYAKLREGRGP